jgi:predicted phosphodiesterase
MRFHSNQLGIALLTALITVSCATGGSGDPGAPLTRSVPDRDGLGIWLTSGQVDGAKEPAFFIQMADSQLGMSAYSLPLLLSGATFRDDEFALDAQRFEVSIAHANHLQPAFVVICGDLVNRVGHQGQIAEFQRVAGTMDPSIELHLVPGNHDVGGEPTEETLNAYRNTFGPDWYSFEKIGIHGIVLNSQLIDFPNHVPREAARQLAWVREELSRARERGATRILVFQHQPFFVEEPGEEDNYANVESEARAVYLEAFKQAGVEAIFAGHLHQNAYGRDGALEMITTGPIGKALGDDPTGFRVVAIEKDGLRHEYFSLEAP